MEQKHRLTRYTVLSAVGGLALNLALSRLALLLQLPLYLDSVGTVLAAMLGGYLPGIVAGFFANLINGIADPVTLFYAVISILIAVAASLLAKRGCFSSVLRALAAVLVFTFIGGVLGSMLTWLLYGYDFGSGITAPFVLALFNMGIPEFFAQLTADTLVDLADKLITVFLCLAMLRLTPAGFLDRFPNRRRYFDPPERGRAAAKTDQMRQSLRVKVVLLIAVSAVVIGSAATAIGAVLYRKTMTDHYTRVAESVVDMELSILSAERISEYIESGPSSVNYIMDEMRLSELRESVPDIQYIYVYRILPDGCHVMFDIDTPELLGEEFGTVLPIDDAFKEYRVTLMAGGEIPAVISNDTYGWLLTVYSPIKDSAGNTLAYAAADVSMERLMTDRAIFVVKMAALLFGISIFIVAFALWFAERRLVDPINAMSAAAGEFAYSSDSQRRSTIDELRQLNISTGDEIEKLYQSLRKTVTDVSTYIEDISAKAEIISRLHRNIIMSFATMVENRDQNTGQHIRRTASYVSTIASQLYADGKYPQLMSDEYISTVVRCAPLHDLGKIKVPDAILNKPGPLTPEEFDQIKLHTTAGKEIIDGIVSDNSGDADYLSEASSMALSHHERWDGKGYPQGLKGEEIPLSARIMAVADVYDALVSKRSYKKAMAVDAAYAIIESEAGSHFDPVVVQAFVRAKGAIIASI